MFGTAPKSKPSCPASGRRHRSRTDHAPLRMAPGSATAAVPPTARRSTATTGSASLPTTRSTRFAASGSPRKRNRATTTASPTKASGRSATSPTPARFRIRLGNVPAVNRKFADARSARNGRHASPIVFVQDYHFALLPRMLKSAGPTLGRHLLAHPLAQSESSASAPGSKSSLEACLAPTSRFPHPGPLQQLPGHVDRYLRGPHRHANASRVNRGGHITMVRPFPISIELPFHGASLAEHSRDRKEGEDSQ